MPKKRIFISQSNYLPWRGYFQSLAISDEVIFLDDVQYTKNDWRNRNQIKSSSGKTWITIPVVTAGLFPNLRICDAEVSSSTWWQSHLSKIQNCYADAPCFFDTFTELKSQFQKVRDEKKLSNINQTLLRGISEFLRLSVSFKNSTEYFTLDELDHFPKSRRVLEICLKSGATHYLSGPAAQAYLDVELLNKHGVEVEWADYSTLGAYEQLHGPYDPYVSIVDLMMMQGEKAHHYIGTNSTL